MGTLASELQPIARDMAQAPRAYADANIPAGAVSIMRRDLGWDVLFVLEHDDLRRASDASHFARAIDLGRILITQDRDFLDDVRFPPAVGPGVIVCTVADERMLIRLLRYIARQLMPTPGAGDEALARRKVVLTSDVLVAPR